MTPIRAQCLVPGVRAPALPRELTVATWNVAWGQGWGSELSGVAPMRTRTDLDAALVKIGRLLAENAVDVALLQETDLGSTRSGDVDQARAIAEHANMPWVVAASSWDVPYLPYPYWPPSRHVGRVRSGGAILSRFPLSNGWIELLPKPRSASAIRRAFLSGRYLMGADVRLGAHTLLAANAHLEAFDPENRRLQAGIVSSRLADLSSRPRVLFGGDLNTIPPNAALQHGFPDEPHTDFRRDPSYRIVSQTSGLTPVPCPASTFPSHAPTRTLDHLFIGRGLSVVSARVETSAGDASDHLPVIASLALDFER